MVGVNSSIFTSSGGSVGLGFAIPIERAQLVVSEILKNGEMRRAYVGLDVEGSGTMRAKRTTALKVVNVDADGPAGAAGFRAGDQLTAANGRALRTWLDWEAVKLDLAVGDTVTVDVADARGKSERRRIVTKDLPSVSAAKVPVFKDLELVTVTPAIRTERRLGTDRGALIFRISDLATRQTGLQPGDVLVGINNTRITDAAEVGQIIERLRGSNGFRLFFERGRRILFTDLYF